MERASFNIFSDFVAAWFQVYFIAHIKWNSAPVSTSLNYAICCKLFCETCWKGGFEFNLGFLYSASLDPILPCQIQL